MPQDTQETWVVTSQMRPDWPACQYNFRDQRQANMFLDMCKRDGDYRYDIAQVSL